MHKTTQDTLLSRYGDSTGSHCRSAALGSKCAQWYRGLILCLAGLLLIALPGCISSALQKSGPGWEKHGPYVLHLTRKVKWTQGRAKGFDRAISGYHFTGDISSLRLRPRGLIKPQKLVLAITTSPGMAPHLDHFRITVPGARIETEPFNKHVRTRIIWADQQKESPQGIERDDYLQFDVVGREVHVTLKPAAMQLLKGECVVSWIDWYR